MLIKKTGVVFNFCAIVVFYNGIFVYIVLFKRLAFVL